jgi:hypothetical protein
MRLELRTPMIRLFHAHYKLDVSVPGIGKSRCIVLTRVCHLNLMILIQNFQCLVPASDNDSLRIFEECFPRTPAKPSGFDPMQWIKDHIHFGPNNTPAELQANNHGGKTVCSHKNNNRSTLPVQRKMFRRRKPKGKKSPPPRNSRGHNKRREMQLMGSSHSRPCQRRIPIFIRWAPLPRWNRPL